MIRQSDILAELFSRSLQAHLPEKEFQKLASTSVLVAGLGGGSNIAELLVRKGIGRLIIADLDIYEPSNIRQRGSLRSSWGQSKALVMHERLNDINPSCDVICLQDGITLKNVKKAVSEATFIVDMLDLHALNEKVALYQAARAMNKIVLTAPSVVNGAVLWVFHPEGMTFESFSGYFPGIELSRMAENLISRVIPAFPTEAPKEMYLAAARGERTIPLDAVGVDQAAVLVAAAIENLSLHRQERVVFVPKGVQVDLSNPVALSKIVELS